MTDSSRVLLRENRLEGNGDRSVEVTNSTDVLGADGDGAAANATAEADA